MISRVWIGIEEELELLLLVKVDEGRSRGNSRDEDVADEETVVSVLNFRRESEIKGVVFVFGGSLLFI